MAQVLSPKEARVRELPSGYHLAHFSEMLAFVERLYGGILGVEARQWLADFHALGPAAQSLFVRLANRKGSVFRVAHLKYADVPDVAATIAELNGAGFLSSLGADDFPAALRVLPKAELSGLLVEADISFRSSWKRARLIDLVLAELCFEDCFSEIARQTFVVRRRRQPLQYLLFLYFGRIEESLTRFTLRDLGLVRTHNFRDQFEARFDNQTDGEESFFYASQLAGLEDRDDGAVLRLASRVETWPAKSEVAAPLRDDLLFALGKRFEKIGDTAQARAMYERGRSAGCGERAVRLAWADGERGAVRSRLEAMIADPASDAEALFAEDFLTRKFDGKRTSAITDMLRSAEVLSVDESQRSQPERGAIEVLRREGWNALHAENAPWRILFGLLFWDVLYGAKGAALHNAFERMPISLRNGAFHDEHSEALEARLALLDDPDLAMRALLKAFAEHHGTPNALFRWNETMIEDVQPLIMFAPKGGLASVLRAMAQDYPNRKDGFPDLMLWRDRALRLIEVKTENDTLRRNQLVQLSHLRALGFDVAVNRVAWVVDPDQPYVVVDIETTGGRPPFHRVTEIGAVRMQGGEIVDRWQSLINPQRSIPRNITALTGISNEMVENAPVFAEIADSFQDFMGDAIFVAHNVRFDHGFLAAEYARLERKFRYPQLCTCQSMRSLFKGLPSYSLGNLCRHFEIPLESHHRALCDAEAAAGLLVLINERRMAA